MMTKKNQMVRMNSPAQIGQNDREKIEKSYKNTALKERCSCSGLGLNESSSGIIIILLSKYQDLITFFNHFKQVSHCGNRTYASFLFATNLEACSAGI